MSASSDAYHAAPQKLLNALASWKTRNTVLGIRPLVWYLLAAGSFSTWDIWRTDAAALRNGQTPPPDGLLPWIQPQESWTHNPELPYPSDPSGIRYNAAETLREQLPVTYRATYKPPRSYWTGRPRRRRNLPRS